MIDAETQRKDRNYSRSSPRNVSSAISSCHVPSQNLPACLVPAAQFSTERALLAWFGYYNQVHFRPSCRLCGFKSDGRYLGLEVEHT